MKDHIVISVGAAAAAGATVAGAAVAGAAVAGAAGACVAATAGAGAAGAQLTHSTSAMIQTRRLETNLSFFILQFSS